MEKSTVIEQREQRNRYTNMKNYLESLKVLNEVKNNVMEGNEKKAFLNQAPDHHELEKKKQYKGFSKSY